MKCGSCTLCCKLLLIPWMGSPAGEYCKKCSPEKGCKLWPDAPQKCKSFNCAYRQMNKVSLGLRPDKCGLIFEKIEDTFFLGTPDNNFKLNRLLERQIAALVREGYSVVINGKRPTVWLAEGHTQTMLKQIWRKALNRKEVS